MTVASILIDLPSLLMLGVPSILLVLKAAELMLESVDEDDL